VAVAPHAAPRKKRPAPGLIRLGRAPALVQHTARRRVLQSDAAAA